MWTYPSELVEALPGFGLAPTPDTPPRLVREQLSDLYTWELRRLRSRLVAGEFPKSEYAGFVVTLRKKYWPLSATPAQWDVICAYRADPATGD